MALFGSRPDKSWSLTDCISFAVMEAHGISDVLTCDHHFAQAGFRVLLIDADSQANATVQAGVPVAELARVLIRLGLAELKRGNGDLDRAIKTSRDAKRPGAVGPRT